MRSTIEVRAGTRVWIDGATWVVHELGRSAITLVNATTMRAAATSEFLAYARLMDEQDTAPSDTDLVAVVLGSLSKHELAKLEQRAALRGQIADRKTLVEQLLAAHRDDSPPPPSDPPGRRLKRYRDD